jgi:hypothetical protein
MIVGLAAFLLWFTISVHAQPPSIDLKIKQLTFGEKHHFFGYIGQCLTMDA